MITADAGSLTFADVALVKKLYIKCGRYCAFSRIERDKYFDKNLR